MKEKFVKWSRPLLATCMALGMWISCNCASIIFFGEYEYPQNPIMK